MVFVHLNYLSYSPVKALNRPSHTITAIECTFQRSSPFVIAVIIDKQVIAGWGSGETGMRGGAVGVVGEDG